MNQKELEMKIITHICTYEDDMSMLLSEGIDDEYFIHAENGRDPELRNLFISARNYYQKFNRLLSQETLESKIKQKDEDIKSSKILSLFIQSMLLEIDHNSFPMLLKDLRSRKMYTIIQDVMHTIDDSLKNDSPAATFDKLKDKILQTESNLNKNTKVGNRIYTLNESYNDIVVSYFDKKNNPEKYKGIEVGLLKLDAATNGFKPATLNIIVGASGAGKSIALTNLAAEVFKRQYNTLFFSLEMPLPQVIARYVARELCIDYDKFYNGKLSPEEEEILVTRLPDIIGDRSQNGIINSKNNDAFFTVLTNFDNPDVDYIEEMIKRHQKMYGKVDVIFVDYLNNMTSKEVLKRNGQKWEHPGVCASGLRRLAANYNFTVFTAQQLNRSGLEKGRKTMDSSPEDFQANQEDMTGSQTAFHDADSVIAVNADIQNFRMYFRKVKARDFTFEPFFANYYPRMSRIVDANTDDTPLLLSPLDAQRNLSHQLDVDSNNNVLGEFEDGF